MSAKRVIEIASKFETFDFESRHDMARIREWAKTGYSAQAAKLALKIIERVDGFYGPDYFEAYCLEEKVAKRERARIAARAS